MVPRDVTPRQSTSTSLYYRPLHYSSCMLICRLNCQFLGSPVSGCQQLQSDCNLQSPLPWNESKFREKGLPASSSSSSFPGLTLPSPCGLWTSVFTLNPFWVLGTHFFPYCFPHIDVLEGLGTNFQKASLFCWSLFHFPLCVFRVIQSSSHDACSW